MNTEQMRLELLRFYGESWQAKVRKMSASQVLAVYLRFKSEGKIK